MPIRFDGDQAFFEEVCAVEESETLQHWLVDHPQAQLEFAACTHLHTAVLQVVLCSNARKGQPPADSILRAALYSKPQRGDTP